MQETAMNFRLLYILFTTLCYVQSSSLDKTSTGCRLNFSSYPYQPVGGCSQVQENLDEWNGFPRSTCCQNALIVLSYGLAHQALETPSRTIFVDKDLWNDCSGPFRKQPNVSAHNCGFDGFYYGSSHCSTLSLPIFDKYTIDQCSLFSSSSFDHACENCTSAISSATDSLLQDLKADEDNNTEKATCLVALIVSLIAEKLNGSSQIDDFSRCLPALALPEKEDYIKINNSLAKVFIAIILATIGLTVVIALIKYVLKNRKKEKPPLKIKEKRPLKIKDIVTSCSGLYRFSKAEIESATNYGPEKKFLGRGSTGRVYKGMLPSGQIVAIKQIYKSDTSDSFTREIESLSRVRHSNLVCLFGYCHEDGEQYLVYEYCSNGNLAQRLLRKDTVLTWELRVKILRDCAYALRYLHNREDGCIVHRDIKLTNILLTHNMDPKLSDFGLAKMLGMEESKVYTDVRGTMGYMNPEYMSNAKLIRASDIYSFGIVILQLLSGQRVTELDLDSRDQLTRKAKDVYRMRRPITDFQDQRMKGDVITVDFESILQIAVLSVAKSSTGRPTIDLVFEELDKAYKNTQAENKARKEKGLLVKTASKSLDGIRGR